MGMLTAGWRLLFPRYEQPTVDASAHRDTTFTLWHANNTKKVVMQYRDGKRHGTWTYWDAAGRIQAIHQYDNGVLVARESPPDAA